jgi:hypothetical protein
VALAWVKGPPPPPPKPPSSERLAAFGLKWDGDDADDDVPDWQIDVWPENFTAARVFFAMGTQWRISSGMGGAVWHGMDFNVLPVVEDRLGVKSDEQQDLFIRLQTMQSAARSELNRAK